MAWLPATGASTGWGVLAVEYSTGDPMAAGGAAGLFFNSCTLTTGGTLFRLDSAKELTAGD